MIGVHTVTVAGLDISCLVDDVSLVHGRGDTTGQPAASAATIALDLYGVELPLEAEIGAEIEVATALVDGDPPAVRFRGRLTDVSLGWDDNTTDTPVSGIGQLVAVGPLADLGRRVIGDEPWPAELDGARVARALTLAGVTLDPATSDPGTVVILPRDVDATDTLTIISDTATSAAGLVWETAGGEIRYADAEHRRGAEHRLALDSCDLLVSPVWSRTLQGVTNKVSLGYGPTPEGSEQPRVEAINAASVARYGIYDYSTSTMLESEADATEAAGLLIARNAYPVWIMPELPVDLAGLDATTTAALLALDVGDLLELTGLPKVTESAPTTAAHGSRGGPNDSRSGSTRSPSWCPGTAEPSPRRRGTTRPPTSRGTTSPPPPTG